MSMTDPIADLLTRIRNALMANHESVSVPHSKTREAVVKILKEEGFLQAYSVEKRETFPVLNIVLKYEQDRKPAIRSMQRVSKPGRRVFTGKAEVPLVLGGLGINILSTSRGIMTGKAARSEGVGGEILCEVW